MVQKHTYWWGILLIAKYFVSIVILFVFFTIIYDKFFVFTVFPGDEVIITSFGRIIGEPKKSGVHKKIPIFETVNIINVQKVRKWEDVHLGEQCGRLNIFWNISDSKIFFSLSQSSDFPQKLDSEFSRIFYFIEHNLNESFSEKSIKNNCIEGRLDIDPSFLSGIENFNLYTYGLKIIKLRLLDCDLPHTK